MADTDSIKQLIDTAVSGYNGEQIAADGGKRFSLTELKLKGLHNVKN